MEKHKIAVDQFLGGLKCSQAVLGVFSEDFDIDPDLAQKISLALAGGSGLKGECGAVSAAYLINGLKYEDFQLIVEKNVEFAEKFKALNGKINCHELISLDIFSEEGHNKFVKNNMKEFTCSKFVKDAVEILEEIQKESV